MDASARLYQASGFTAVATCVGDNDIETTFQVASVAYNDSSGHCVLSTYQEILNFGDDFSITNHQ